MFVSCATRQFRAAGTHVSVTRISVARIPVLTKCIACRYYWRSNTDTGIVENSAEAVVLDEPVLRAELDLEELARDT